MSKFSNVDFGFAIKSSFLSFRSLNFFFKLGFPRESTSNSLKSISSTVISYLPIGLTIGVIILAELMLVLFTWKRDYSVTDNLSLSTDTQYSNTEIIGLVLYTDNILFFQLAGLILLVSMIGAIVLTVNHRPSAKRQDINKQVERDAESSIKNIDM